MSHIFISHSSKNDEYTKKLSTYLRKEGFSVWLDNESISYGLEWDEAIYEGVVNCQIFIVIMTADSRKSKWVKREIAWAEEFNKPVFPILLSGKNFPNFVTTQYYDAQDHKMPTQEFIKSLRDFLPKVRDIPSKIITQNEMIRTDGLFIRRVVGDDLLLDYINLVWYETLKFNDDFTLNVFQSTSPEILDEKTIINLGDNENYEITTSHLVFKIMGQRYVGRYHANKLFGSYLTIGQHNSVIQNFVAYNFFPFED